MPGFDARYIRSPNPYVVERSAERFAQFTTGGLDLLGPHKILLVTSFNEWHEGTEIEPSVEHGYELLQALADSLRNIR